MGLLQDRVAIVTGAGGLHGIGRAIALAYAENGCRVAVAGGSAVDQVAKEIQSGGGAAIAIPCDVSSPSDIESLVQRTEAELGSIDILCNNAGILRRGHLHEITLDDWNRTLAVNLTGLFLCTQTVAARMSARGAGGRIVNISSLCGHQGCPGQVSYAASKAGVEGFTKSIAEDLGKHGVTANCIAPGPVYTNMTGKPAPSGQAAVRWNGAPIPDFGLPPDVAGAAVFLASDLASWITAATLIVDGGRLVQ
jgi:3-oxoacyl-[acyl-carrier protein] reductase